MPAAPVPVRPATQRPAAAELDEQPSWPEVIATTLRLWVRRRILRRDASSYDREPGRSRGASRRGVIAVLIVIVLVFAAGALTYALTQAKSGTHPHHRVASPAGRSQASPKTGVGQPAPGPVAQAAANRRAAASWITAQVSHSETVSCDPVMCAQLQQAGFPAGDLLTLEPSQTDPMGSGIVVATTALRSQFGSRLPDIYAPVVLASFGTGASRVDVRVEAPDGSAAYLVEQRADLLARQVAGRGLARSKTVHVAGAARRDLLAGKVDSRLLIILDGLAGVDGRVYVTGFGGSAPGASAGVPLRMMQIDALTAPRHGPKDAYLNSVRNFLAQQRDPLRARVAVLHRPGGRTVIQVSFTAPSLFGLLGQRPTS